MDNNVLIALIGLLGVLLGGGAVTAFVALRKAKPEMRVLDTQGTANIAKAANDIAVAMSAIIKANDDDIISLKERLDEQESITKILTQRKEERELQIKAMEYDIAQTRRQVNEWEQKYNDLKTRYDDFKTKYDKAIEILVKALDDAHIAIPKELADLLGDSVAKFKFPKAAK